MADSFQDFLQTAKPGQKYAYHVGLLMADRQVIDPWSGTWGVNALHYAAKAVYEAYETGRVELIQEKRNGIYIYYAVKRRHRPNRRGHDRPDDRNEQRFGQVLRSRSPRHTALGSGTYRASAGRASYAD